MSIARVTQGSEGFGVAATSWSVDGVVAPGASDVVILGIVTDSGASPSSPPSGFTLIGAAVEPANDFTTTLYWKQAASGPYSVSFNANQEGVAFWVSYAGVNTTTPLEVAAVFEDSDADPSPVVATPSLTPTHTGTMVIGIATTESGASTTMTWAAPAVEVLDVYTALGPPNFGVWVGEKDWTFGPASLTGDLGASKATTRITLALRDAEAVPALEPEPSGIPGSWSLVFNDEFTGTGVDLSKWQPNWFGANDAAITRGANSGEANCIDPALATVADGNLELRVTTHPTTCNSILQPYRAALVSSWDLFYFTYGAYEARCFLPEDPSQPGSGVVANWPAVWATAEPPWPDTGEIDVMEGLGGNAAFNFHYGSDAEQLQSGPDYPAGDWTGWHTFAINWWSDRIDYYYDGVLVGSVSEGVTGEPMYVILAYVVSDDVGDPTVPDGDPMLVDYIRVWEAVAEPAGGRGIVANAGLGGSRG